MGRKKISIGSNAAESNVSKSSSDQQKNFDDRFAQMEAMVNDKFVDIGGSVQKIQASLCENQANTRENFLRIGESVLEIRTMIAGKKEPIGIKKDCKRGFLQATFNIDSIPSASHSSGRSDATYCVGAKWWFEICKDVSGLSLGARLYHKAYSVNISYDTDYTIRLLGSSGNIELKYKSCFEGGSTSWGWPSFVLWSKLVNFSNGFVDEKGNFKMEAEFSVKWNNHTCVRLDSKFLTCGFVESDCTLVVDYRRFSVNKGLLSAYSNYFKTLFYGEFCEKDQDEIELKEVCGDEFLRLLKAIYPPFNDADVNPNNVEGLLRLADRYQVKAVSNRCEQYLKKCAISKVPLQDKLLYAQNYGLSELLGYCINEYKSIDDVKELRASALYSRLDKDIKLQILENVV